MSVSVSMSVSISLTLAMNMSLTLALAGYINSWLRFVRLGLVMYILTSVWVLHTPNPGQNMILCYCKALMAFL